MSKKVIKKEEKDNKGKIIGIVVGMLLLVALCLVGFFLIGWFSRTNPSKEDPNVEEHYNRLLKVLNDDVNKTKADGETEATSLLSFSFKDDHFYISGCNDDVIYYYDANLSSQSLGDKKEAYDYVIANEIENHFEITTTRYSFSSSSEFENKYITEQKMNGKYKCGQYATLSKVFGTLEKESTIYVFNGVGIDETLLDGYNPTKIEKENPLFGIYNYISQSK